MNAIVCGGTVSAGYRLALSCLFALVPSLLMPSLLSASGTPAGTRIDNQATVVYTEADTSIRHVVYGNSLALTVGQRAVVNVAPASAQRTGRLGEVIDYPVRVTNSGNGADSFTIAASSSLGLTAKVYRDINGDGVLTVQEVAAGPIVATPGMIADAEIALVVRLTVADSAALNGSTDLLTVTAASIYDPAQHASAVYRTDIMSAALGVMVSVSNPTPQASSRVTYTIVCTNNGVARTGAITLTDVLHPMLHYVTGSSTPAPGGSTGQTLTWNLPALDPHAAATVTFIVELDDALTAGTELHNPADAVYTDGATQRTVHASEQSFITVTAGGIETVTITPNSSISGEVGDSVAQALVVTNLSAAARDYTLEAVSTLGMRWTMFGDANANGRVDAGETSVTATGAMMPGAALHIVAVARLPLVAIDSTIDTTRFTARSSANPDNAVTCRSLSTIGRPMMSMHKTAFAPHPIAGSNITYTISYANSGSGRAERFRVVDPLPANTTLVSGSVRLNSIAKTEAADGDEATVANAQLSVDVGTVAPGATGTVEFTVRIK